MSGFVSSRHEPPQVLTVVAITCRKCAGEQSFHMQDGGLAWCRDCENGYEKVLVPAHRLMSLCNVMYDEPELLHAAVANLAEENAVRLPVLTHLTSTLPVHLLPSTPRIPLTLQSRTEQK